MNKCVVTFAHRTEACGAEISGAHATISTSLLIVAATVVLIWLLLLVVKRITADNNKHIKKVQEQEKELVPPPPAETEPEMLTCPRCGWLHYPEQKVCSNPRCKIRF